MTRFFQGPSYPGRKKSSGICTLVIFNKEKKANPKGHTYIYIHTENSVKLHTRMNGHEIIYGSQLN